ncbi:hypothetical protein MF271_19070 (plasmid) [Deinococcus sp. KNUC1210]|uniref:XF1762 family protein n=1 Tax=Deinococcus sp. KNUC1210 TaxID=2917691 RepID=UPI001EEFAE4C|nr:XF1762 family protein [Deinococcus sp. KNUC1210]ULH17423.1 hypothetical protein MF271_19070 [Deinococcus sp. KNUC1210]
MSGHIIPLPFGLAAAFNQDHHRHAPKAPNARSHKFSLGLLDGWRVCAVVMVHRPVARHLDDGTRWEVARLCSDGTRRNACSQLYAAAWRETQRQGIHHLGTYTLDTESGASLRGAGWRPVRRLRVRHWDTPTRRRAQQPLPCEYRWYWEAV